MVSEDILSWFPGSPGTPLRRYSSHDSVIRSPKPANTTKPDTAGATELTSNKEKAALDIIEEKRKNALNKLRNRRSRGQLQHWFS